MIGDDETVIIDEDDTIILTSDERERILKELPEEEQESGEASDN